MTKAVIKILQGSAVTQMVQCGLSIIILLQISGSIRSPKIVKIG